eukprot:scaffold84711_cov50-Phaeocystis_antarctica.AAC.1
MKICLSPHPHCRALSLFSASHANKRFLKGSSPRRCRESPCRATARACSVGCRGLPVRPRPLAPQPAPRTGLHRALAGAQLAEASHAVLWRLHRSTDGGAACPCPRPASCSMPIPSADLVLRAERSRAGRRPVLPPAPPPSPGAARPTSPPAPAPPAHPALSPP